MLCQNCGRNDATTHLKRIINGEATEIHLCRSCAGNLGVTEGCPVFLPSFGSDRGLFSENRSRSDTRRNACEICGFTFDDIVRTGMPGCPGCYRTFGEKLMPAVKKLHGRAQYNGKVPCGANEEIRKEYKINELRRELNRAIDEQNFERAAQMRDEIRRILKED